MKKFFQEFKKFITKGNVFDMAVGLIIATAFNKIVSSMVNDIIMPLVTWATGAASLADLSIPLRTAENALGETVVTLAWNYGNFIQTVIDFLIIAFSVFIMVKIMNSSKATLKAFEDRVKKANTKEIKDAKKILKAQAKATGKSYKELWANYEAEKKAEMEAEAKALAEAKAKEEEEYKLTHPTQEQLLTEIRDLLKEKKEDKE